MLNFLDAEGRNAEFAIDAENPSVLHVNAFSFEGKIVQAKDFNMQEHAGKTVRVYLDKDGTYSMAHGVHEWLLFYLKVPELQYESIYSDSDNGTESRTAQQKELPVNLNDTDIVIFPLPAETEEGEA